jgi:hypothetical protein
MSCTNAFLLLTALFESDRIILVKNLALWIMTILLDVSIEPAFFQVVRMVACILKHGQNSMNDKSNSKLAAGCIMHH